MPRKDHRIRRTPEKVQDFLTALQKTGYAIKACKDAGIPHRTVYQWREDDPVFAQQWDEALDAYTQRLEAEADRRGVEGVLEPVYYKGEVVGRIRRYSDTLLMFRLNGLAPDKYRQRHEHTGKDGEHLTITVNCKLTLADALQHAYHVDTPQRQLEAAHRNGHGSH